MYLFIYLFIYLFVYLFMHLFIYLFIYRWANGLQKGKSLFAYYVMWKLTQHRDFANKRVFFQYDKDLVYELLENGARMSSVNEIELSSNSLLFVDNVSKSEPIPCNAQTIAFSSPDSNRYREFRKFHRVCFKSSAY